MIDYLTGTQKKNLTKVRKVAKFLGSSLKISPNTLYNKRLGDNVYILPESLNRLEEALLVVVPEVLKMKNCTPEDLYRIIVRILAQTKSWNTLRLFDSSGRPKTREYEIKVRDDLT